MPASNLVEHFSCRPRPSSLHVSQSTLNALDRLYAIEELLVGRRVLNDDLAASFQRWYPAFIAPNPSVDATVVAA